MITLNNGIPTRKIKLDNMFQSEMFYLCLPVDVSPWMSPRGCLLVDIFDFLYCFHCEECNNIQQDNLFDSR